MKKNLPATDIANDLAESSVFFPRPVRPDGSQAPVTQPQMALGTEEHVPTPSLGNEGSNEAPAQRTNERSVERRKLRHTFDILQDQLASLRRIQLAREERLGKRYLLGELVQEALDLFITKEQTNK